MLSSLCHSLPFPVSPLLSLPFVFFSRLEDVASWLAGSNVRVSGFEAELAVFMCTHRVVLASFVFHLLSSCLFSALVRTAGCLSPSPSLVPAEALHVGSFFFSSLIIHIPLLLSSCLSCWNGCACRGKLSSSDTWHCLSVLTNLVRPALAVMTKESD